KKIAVRLGMSSKSVLRFARRYNEAGNVHADNQGIPAGSYALSQQDRAVLLQEMLKHPERTLGELCEHISRVCGTMVAVPTLRDYFSRNGITHKMLRRTPSQRCEDDRVDYWSVVSLLNPAMLVFLEWI
ncbi:hypothetical protein QZH41_008762, partial [Actinostola sp. cb2023]